MQLIVIVKRIPVVDTSLGSHILYKDYEWAAWTNSSPGPGAFGASIVEAVGLHVRNELQFGNWEWSTQLQATKMRLLENFPLDTATRDDYVADLGTWCIEEGASIGLHVRILVPNTGWGFRVPDKSDLS